MNWIYPVIATLLITPGYLMIQHYQELKAQNKAGRHTSKIQSAGIDCLIIGIGMIIREFLQENIYYDNFWYRNIKVKKKRTY